MMIREPGSVARLAGAVLALSVFIVAPAGSDPAAVATRPGATSERISFEALAEGCADRLGGAGTAEGLEAVLEAGYYRIDLGAFDLRYPRAFLAEEGALEDLSDVLVGLVRAHGVWIEWAAGDVPRDLAKDLATLEKWVGGWKKFQPAEGDGPGGLISALDPRAKNVPALERLTSYVRTLEFMDPEEAARSGALIVLAPTRRHFMELAGYLGAENENMKGVLWDESVATWTEFSMAYPVQLQVVAMQYASTPVTMESLDEGRSMNEREKTGLVQHVVQRAGYGLSAFTFGGELDAVFEAGLAQNLAIEVCGENNCRSGGSGAGSKTEAFEQFVPGGVPSGGILPPVNADSRWREKRGKDFFFEALQRAQKSGAKAAGKKADPILHFVLSSQNPIGEHLVRAPFLGAAGQAQEAAPEEFLSDYLEFFRAYKSAFAHWLRTDGGRNKKDSSAKWSELLHRLTAEEAIFESECASVYGVQLSDEEDPRGDTLERRFLRAISKS